MNDKQMTENPTVPNRGFSGLWRVTASITKSSSSHSATASMLLAR